MSGFSAQWLALREPFDHAARSAAWPGLAYAPARAAGAVLPVIDLACGSGANLRELAPRLGGAQHWQLVDHDPLLLQAVPQALADWARRQQHRFSIDPAGVCQVVGLGFSATVTRRQLDLARDLATLDFGPAPLVTASALLDLVSAAWLQRLVHQAAQAGATMLLALTVDGRTLWEPADLADDVVHRLFQHHQRRDKGFGPALGPQAVAAALSLCTQAGYRVRQAASDWLIDGTASGGMQAAMIEGMAAAALEQDPGSSAAVQAWVTRRLAQRSATRLRVGHVDLLALP